MHCCSLSLRLPSPFPLRMMLMQSLELGIPVDEEAQNVFESIQFFAVPGHPIPLSPFPPSVWMLTNHMCPMSPLPPSVWTLTNHIVCLLHVERVDDLYAFQYQPDYDSDVDGWNLYNPRLEYHRFGVPSDKWELTPDNHDYQVLSQGADKDTYGDRSQNSPNKPQLDRNVHIIGVDLLVCPVC